MSTIVTAVILLGILGGIIGLLVYVHNRDQKKEAEKASSR